MEHHIRCACGALFVIIPSKHIGLTDAMSTTEVLDSQEIRQWPKLIRWNKEHRDCRR